MLFIYAKVFNSVNYFYSCNFPNRVTSIVMVVTNMNTSDPPASTGQQRPLAPEPRGVATVVRSTYSHLSPAERRIADNLLADRAGFARSSISEVALDAETSTTTVVRFYKRIGYRRFKDLLHDLSQEAARDQMSATEFPAEASDIDRHDSLSQVVAKVARDETLSLSDTAKLLDTEELRRAVELTASAARVDMFGIGASSIASRDLQQKLTRIGRTAIEWSEAHAAWTSASVLGTDAVAIAVSHSGQTSDTIEFLRLARSSGASTIAITNMVDSPLEREADVVLRTAAHESSFRSGALGSRIAQLLVVDCLFIGIVQQHYDASVEALRATYGAVQSRATRNATR